MKPTQPSQDALSGNDCPTDGNSRPPSIRYRPLLIVLFALILLCIASSAKAQAVYGPVGAVNFGERSSCQPQIVPMLESSHHKVIESAPAYAELAAELANFDADADPDGWRVIVGLRDKHDQLVQPRARIEFELMPRFADSEFQGFKNAQRKPLKWSPKLSYNADGTASFKLPLRSDLRPLWGWSSAVFSQTGSRSTIVNDRATYQSTHLGGARNRAGRLPNRAGSTVGNNWRESIALPELGQLQAKVFVPSKGVFKAVTGVRIRTPVLVDTNWPYR